MPIPTCQPPQPPPPCAAAGAADRQAATLPAASSVKILVKAFIILTSGRVTVLHEELGTVTIFSSRDRMRRQRFPNHEKTGLPLRKGRSVILAGAKKLADQNPSSWIFPSKLPPSRCVALDSFSCGTPVR